MNIGSHQEFAGTALLDISICVIVRPGKSGNLKASASVQSDSQRVGGIAAYITNQPSSMKRLPSQIAKHSYHFLPTLSTIVNYILPLLAP